MTKISINGRFYLNIINMRDIFIILWAIILSFVTLTQGSTSIALTSLTYPAIYLPFIFFPFFRFKLLNNRRKKISVVLLFFFLITGLISSGYHNDKAMIYSLFVLVSFLLTGLYLYPALFDRKQRLLFFNTVYFFSIVYFILMSVEYKLSVGSSMGYINTNTLGLASATVATLGLGLLFLSFEEGVRIRYKLCYVAGTLFTVYLTLLSVSRTAFLSMFFVFFLLTVAYWLRNKKAEKIKLVVVITLLAAISLYMFGDLLYETIIDKFQRKSGDIFDSRSLIWGFILENTGFLGLGMDFFRHEAFIAAHSTYFSFLGRYGWFLFIPFFVFLLFLICDSFYQLAYKEKDSLGFVNLALLFGFLAMSFSEIMIFKSIMVYAFLFLGGDFEKKDYFSRKH